MFEMMYEIRTHREVFGELGFPQVAKITKIDGSLYALIFITKVDLGLGDVGFVETDDPQGALEANTDFMNRIGISASFGDKLGGFLPPILYDTAALVKLDGNLPEILKVYDISTSEPLSFENRSRIYDIIFEYAYADLVRMTKENSCAQKILAPKA